MSVVENLKSYEAIADAHADGMKKLVPTFEALYAKMSDAQKKTADAVFSQPTRARTKAKAKAKAKAKTGRPRAEARRGEMPMSASLPQRLRWCAGRQNCGTAAAGSRDNHDRGRARHMRHRLPPINSSLDFR